MEKAAISFLHAAVGKMHAERVSTAARHPHKGVQTNLTELLFKIKRVHTEGTALPEQANSNLEDNGDQRRNPQARRDSVRKINNSLQLLPDKPSATMQLICDDTVPVSWGGVRGTVCLQQPM